MMRYYITISMLFILISGCTSQKISKLDNLLANIHNEYNYIPLDDWILVQNLIYADSTEYYNLYYNNDTSYSIEFELYNYEYLKPDYDVIWFQKTYSDSIHINTILFEGRDTVVYYKTLKSPKASKIFVIGKYYYLYLFPKELEKLGFSESQYLYIREKLDSLKRIRGDNLFFPI